MNGTVDTMTDNFPTDDGYPAIPKPVEIVPDPPEEAEVKPPPPNADKPLPEVVPDFIEELRKDQESIGRGNLVEENKKRRRRGLDALPGRAVE